MATAADVRFGDLRSGKSDAECEGEVPAVVYLRLQQDFSQWSTFPSKVRGIFFKHAGGSFSIDTAYSIPVSTAKTQIFKAALV